MKNLLVGQVRLGNLFLAENHKGEVVQRRVVGGLFGTVEKYFTVDMEGKLKSNARETIEEVLEDYEIKAVSVSEFDTEDLRIFLPNDFDKVKIRRGIVVGVLLDGQLVYRQIVGGKQFDTTAWFAIDPETGVRKSKTTYNDSQEVLDSYGDKVQFILA